MTLLSTATLPFANPLITLVKTIIGNVVAKPKRIDESAAPAHPYEDLIRFRAIIL